MFYQDLSWEKTHLSKYLYEDKFNKNGLPLNFVYQNTYSYNYLKQIFKKNGARKIEFIDDKSQYNNINKEFQKYKKNKMQLQKF